MIIAVTRESLFFNFHYRPFIIFYVIIVSPTKVTVNIFCDFRWICLKTLARYACL